MTAEDLQSISKKYKIGQMIKINTYKAMDSDTGGRGPLVRKAEIVAKYPYFAVVKLDNGVTDSILWIDLVTKFKPGK